MSVHAEEASLAYVAKTSAGWVGRSFNDDQGWAVRASADGETWTAAYRVAGLPGGLAVGGGRIVVSSEAGLMGGAWPAEGELVPVDAAPPAALTWHVAWNGKQFLALADGWALVSSDGLAWTRHRWQAEDDDRSGEIAGLAWGADVWVAGVNAVENGSNVRYLIVSPDGAAWEEIERVQGEILGAVVFGNGRFLAASNDGVFHASTDGHTWEEVEAGPGFSDKLAWDGSCFRVTEYDSSARSEDGLTWEETVPGKSGELLAFVASDDGLSRVLLFDAATRTTRIGSFDDWKPAAAVQETAAVAVPTSSVTHQVADFAALAAERAAREAAQPRVALARPLVELFAGYDAAMAQARDRATRVRVSLDYLKTLQAAGIPEEKAEVIEVARRIKLRAPRDGGGGQPRFDFDDLFLLMMKASEKHVAWIRESLDSAERMIIQQMAKKFQMFGYATEPAYQPPEKDAKQTAVNFPALDLDALRRRAFAGDKVACAELFQIYFHGQGTVRNRDAYAYWRDRAERRGWQHGKGRDIDEELGIFSRQGSVFALMALAVRTYGKDPQAGRPLLERAARAGAGPAALALGGIHDDPKNPADFSPAKVAGWYEIGAKSGYVPACYYLAEMLETDAEGVSADPARARTLYRQAAEAGHPYAMDRLARMLREGAGGAPDLAAATEWTERARAEGVYRDVDQMIAAMDRMNEINAELNAKMGATARATAEKLKEIDRKAREEIEAILGKAKPVDEAAANP